MKRWTILLALVACACPSKPTAPTPGAGTGSGSAAAVAPSCDPMRAKIEQLYRAEAAIKQPKRVEQAVADNVAMVMADCAKDPTKVAACLETAQTVAEIEKQCVAPLDDEGTEGEAKR